MAVTSTNIIIGAGTLYVAPSGTAEGDVVAEQYDVGGTQGGVTLGYEAEYKDIEVDQQLAIVGKKRIKEKFLVKTQMAEATLNNLLLAWGLPTANLSGGTLTFGESTVKDVPEKVIAVVGTGPNGGSRTATFWRAVASGKAEIAMKKDDVTLLNVEFEVLADSTKSDGQALGKIVDAAADTTAPTVIFSPVDAAVGVAVGDNITLTFNEAMRASTINSSNIQVLRLDTGAEIAAVFTHNSTTHVTTINPTGNLPAATGILVRVTANVKNAYGTAIVATSAKFTTA